MSILTAASSSSVMRGYEYYKSGCVLSFEKVGDDEYEGFVTGRQEEPYHVFLNVKHPKKSYCSCPFASSSKVICKHMVALYFAIFEDEADDYESWLNSDGFDENRFFDDEYEDWRDEDDYYGCDGNGFTLPSCYDQLLDDYVNSFSYEELKENYKNELNLDKKDTFDRYLKSRYESYIKMQGGDYLFLERLSQRLNKISNVYDYDYNDFRTEILSKHDKTKIASIYRNSRFKRLLEDVLLNPKLAVYYEYLWVIRFFRDKLDSDKKNRLTCELDNYFNSLKHYMIRNTIPKSNVLICKHELNNYSTDELAQSMLKNAKYEEYVLHVIDNVPNADELYDSLINRIEKYKGYNKSNIPNILLLFNRRFENSADKLGKMLIDESYYDFMFNYREESLTYLLKVCPERVTKIEKNAYKAEQLLPLYFLTGQTEKLYSLIKEQNSDYCLNKYIEALKDKYNEELYEHYRSRFFNELSFGQGREAYSRAAQNLTYIHRLNGGKDLINNLIDQLKESSYKNRPALFDEINSVLLRIRKQKR